MINNPYKKKKVAVWYWPGTNCEAESIETWKLIGADPELVFAKDFMSGAKIIRDYAIHHFAGGFTYSDDAGAGAIAAIMSEEAIQMLVDAQLPTILICNGFQIGVRSLVFGSGLALVENDCGEFQSIPVSHQVLPSNCIWTKGLEYEKLSFPAAHKFGKFIVVGNNQPNINLVYESHSPNGGKIAGICSDNGLIFGLMDHPERPFGNSDGLKIFQNGLRAA